MKTLFIASMIMTLASCKDDGSSQFMNLDTLIEISVSDHEGSDLLDPSNLNGFDFNQIKLFYLKENEKKEVYDPNLDLPRNLDLIKYPSEFRLRLFPIEPEIGQSSSTSYIRWNDLDEDTIVCKFQSGQNFLTVSEVILNGSLVWSLIGDRDDRYFSITK